MSASSPFAFLLSLCLPLATGLPAFISFPIRLLHVLRLHPPPFTGFFPWRGHALASPLSRTAPDTVCVY
ncbi:Hypothetical protein CAP_7494 [Chondromyces apiculatus DSM 436]|uniref:Uncharacterized protein n=1 Tax=Chondromyces apiculatus DSM 436 TaxID=1192034 RepID=A0A017SZK3_9BACT|nr:Hypothetical protein CAP_7494 [Chondromyces apiculatus DSM 436]